MRLSEYNVGHLRMEKSAGRRCKIISLLDGLKGTIRKVTKCIFQQLRI